MDFEHLGGFQGAREDPSVELSHYNKGGTWGGGTTRFEPGACKREVSSGLLESGTWFSFAFCFDALAQLGSCGPTHSVKRTPGRLLEADHCGG